MSDGARAPDDAGPSWLAWLWFGALALPFHPLWTDFEQVRRGLLLVIAGTTTLGLMWWPGRQLVAARGERFGWLFVTGLVLSTLLQSGVHLLHHDAATPWSLRYELAAFRVLHWCALLIALRAGAAVGAARSALPIAAVLLITSLFGLLQRTGIAELGGYGTAGEPVSTLGNLNVASEWTAIAAVAVAALLHMLRGRAQVLGVTALLLAGAYLVVNHSRSGLVALPICLVLLVLMRRTAAAALPLGVALLGALLGLGIDNALARPTPADPAAVAAARERATVTLDVRLQIAAASTDLFTESPLFGHGPGQFQVQYPRVRRQQEIEASSFERRFSTEVRTAHDDWLELLLDGGLPALILFSTMLFALQRGQRDKSRLLPMLALLLLMLVRAPTGNAPAAALAFWLLGTRAPAVAAASRPGRALSRAGGMLLCLLMLACGALPILGNFAFVPFVRAARDGHELPRTAARAAHAWMPYEPRWLQAEARLALAAGEPADAARLAASAVRLRPFSPPLLLLLAEALARLHRYGEAIEVSRFARDFDAANPELRVLESVAQAELGDVDRAIAAVVRNPHPRLKEQLQRHFADLALRAEQRNEPEQAARYVIEYAWLGLIDRLGRTGDDVRTQRDQLGEQLRQRIRAADREAVDARIPVANALLALEIDKPQLAARFADVARRSDARLTDWQAALLGDHLERLRQVDGWAGLLPAAGR